MTCALLLVVMALLALSPAAGAQPLSTCPCNASLQGFRQHWFEAPSPSSHEGAVEIRWAIAKGQSCIASISAANCTLYADASASERAWVWGLPDGRIQSVNTAACACPPVLVAAPPPWS